MGKQWKQWPTLFYWAPQITVDGDCSQEIKRRLLLGRKAITSLLKSRDITLPTKVCVVKALVFPVVMYGCELDPKEGWAPKNWCFRIVMLEKTFESLMDSKEIKAVNPKRSQPWVFIGRTDAESEAQYFGHLMRRGESLEKTLMLGKIEGRRRRRLQRTRWLYVITNSMDMRLSKLQEMVKERKAWHAAVHAIAESQTRLSGWAPANILLKRERFKVSRKGLKQREKNPGKILYALDVL